ncbi:MAG: phosphocholine cytidylyltransferase family protein [Campylobacterales bacterium]|nr:phosphocholine cytidylyltransferase family protein [Campylobacterales bacterium]
MVKTAVIVAGGLGTRLKERTEFIPKGFLELKEKSLIERSIENLFNAGIEKVYIGTGYLSEVYEEFASKNPNIETIKSDKFETTSSMYTLYNMREQVKDDFLLLESDLLYEKSALKFLQDDETKDIVLASGKTYSNDEVYIEVDNQSNLVGMSKIKEELNSLDCELVGISKISKNRYQMMCDVFENQDNPKIDYEYIMVQTSKKEPYPVKKIEELVWCEIDDENHLSRALEKILPKIEEKDGIN